MAAKMRTTSEDSSTVKPSSKNQKSSKDQKSETKKPEYPEVSFLSLYKYATTSDKINLFIATVLCTITAACNSGLSLVFGQITGAIVDYMFVIKNSNVKEELDKAEEDLDYELLWFIIVTTAFGVISLILTYVSTVQFNYSALRQTYKIRNLFLKKILNQDIPWFDVNQTGDFASRVADDLRKIEEGIGEKAATFMFYEMTCITSILQGLIIGWELALICMISFPVSSILLAFVAWISSKLAREEMDAYGEAGSIAEETLSSIRTVVAFGGQPIEEERYNKLLVSARDNNIKRSLLSGISNGIMWFVSYASYALAFWYGVKLVITERDLPKDEITYTPANMIIVFFSILTATWYFGMASPFIETFGIARGAASKIYAVIASEPVINASKGRGKKLNKIEGNIVFNNVDFHYPSRPDIQILRGLSLTIKSGETVALVGSSGCGKSTCIQLIQRYYDPLIGNVYIDDINIRDFDLTWLRSQIGVVGQEPSLFEASISENIKFGKRDATQEDVIKAAQKANAHTFISALPESYDTMVGERGAQLSGGQKQRIAIARALVREPSILLLDEATSALDTNSEAVVQAALDAASTECTTIIVAHRLSTVRKADRIVVIKEGDVLEEGTHDKLMEKKGAYYKLVEAQVSAADDIYNEENNEKNVTKKRGNELSMHSYQNSESKHEKMPSYTVADTSQIVEETETKSTSSLWTVMKLNLPEWWLIVIGCISSIIAGAAMPIYAIVFGDVVAILALDDEDYIYKQTATLCIFFVLIGVASGGSNVFQLYTFGVAGEKLTLRLRSLMFKAILQQEMGWFDNSENGVGSLCARLAGDPSSVQGATGLRIGTILNAFSTTVLASGIGLYYEWRVALVAMVFAPLIVLTMVVESRMISKDGQGHHRALQRSTKIAVEGISNIRTVASLGCEDVFHKIYLTELVPYQAAAKRNTHYRGIVFGIARSLHFFAHLAALWYGTVLVREGDTDYKAVFIVTEALLTSSWALATAIAFTPNFQKGLLAATRIFELLNRVPKILDGSEDANKRWATGNIKYEKVYFTYPTRPTTTILRGLDLSILQGKMVALVGPSGCGKSTIVQLIERFYDPTYGAVSVDHQDTKTMNLSALRSHLGIVSQEPNLFSKTIAENIAYGDNSRTVGKEEIIQAAKNANIHNFIAALPLGYDTKLGEKGTQLSGGQKQRIAIARALVRNPKVLLLDEATSALDAESEKIVQEALDNAKVGRTCISIAHRLTTIQDADVICVINHGRVAEMGTHSELISLRGIYYNLHSLQNVA